MSATARNRLELCQYVFGRHAIMRALAVSFALLWLASGGIVTPAVARGPLAQEDRWNPHHIADLPPEIRARLPTYARACGSPLAAEHLFARYLKRGNADLIGLHFELFRCERRQAICTEAGCLHHVYISNGGRYRLLKSLYIDELDLTDVRLPSRWSH